MFPVVVLKVFVTNKRRLSFRKSVSSFSTSLSIPPSAFSREMSISNIAVQAWPVTKKLPVFGERERYLWLASIAGSLVSTNPKILGLRVVVQIVSNSFCCRRCWSLLPNVN